MLLQSLSWSTKDFQFDSLYDIEVTEITDKQKIIYELVIISKFFNLYYINYLFIKVIHSFN